MNDIILILALTLATILIVAYARGDRFAESSYSHHEYDDLGDVEERKHLAPRR